MNIATAFRKDILNCTKKIVGKKFVKADAKALEKRIENNITEYLTH